MRTSGPGLTSGGQFVEEFERRLDANRIGETERLAFTARAQREVLAISSADTLSPVQIAWINVLGDLWRKGDISDAEACRVFAPAVVRRPTISALYVHGFVWQAGPFDVMRGGNRIGAYAWYLEGERLVSLPNDFNVCGGNGCGFDWPIATTDPRVSIALAVSIHGPKAAADKVWVMWFEPSPIDPSQPRHVRHEIVDTSEFEDRMQRIAAG